MMLQLSLLLGIFLFTIPLSHELPDARTSNVDGLDESLEQLIAKVSASERERGLMSDTARNQEKSFRQNENNKENVQKVGDTDVIRQDISDENGNIKEQRYRDCNKRQELIVMKPGTKDEKCLLHDMDDKQYSYECEKKGKSQVLYLYEITGEVKDKTFLKKAGIPLCQNGNLSLMEPISKDDNQRREMALGMAARECKKYCCNSGWWGSCANECVACG